MNVDVGSDSASPASPPCTGGVGDADPAASGGALLVERTSGGVPSLPSELHDAHARTRQAADANVRIINRTRIRVFCTLHRTSTRTYDSVLLSIHVLMCGIELNDIWPLLVVQSSLPRGLVTDTSP